MLIAFCVRSRPGVLPCFPRRAKEDALPYEKFLSEVEDRAGLEDGDEAERTAAAVLQALTDRLVGGEADDLLAQLPAPLKDAIVVTE